MRPEVPEGVGPHEGRELELMLAGKKPAAMFGDAIQFRDIIPEEDFAPHVAAGRIVKREFYWEEPESGHSFVEIYSALPGEEWRIDALRELNRIAREKRRPWTDDDEIATGRLLGYSQDEIAVFLKWRARHNT